MLTAQTIVVLVCIVMALGWLLLGALCPVGGQWERFSQEGPKISGEPKERLLLGQFGPFVVGRREVAGGYQSYSGFMWGRRLHLKRRDFGVEQLKRQGFPDAVAHKLEGEVTGHLRLVLTPDKLFLQGYFVPYKIEFTHAPPKITSIVPEPSIPRAYRRVQFVEHKSIVPVQVQR